MNARYQKYTARWLFKQGTEVDPKDVLVWQAWGILETKAGNIGKVEQPYSARWLFKQGIEANPKYAPVWRERALLEKQQRNIGKIDQKYTARWLFKQGTEADPKYTLIWLTWALLEKQQRNIGKIEQQHSARWLFKQGARSDPKDVSTWQAWTMMEKYLGHFANAKQIVQQGLKHVPDAYELLDLLKMINQQKNEDIATLIKQGKCAQAMQRLQQALLDNPHDETVLKLWQLWQEKCKKSM